MSKVKMVDSLGDQVLKTERSSITSFNKMCDDESTVEKDEIERQTGLAVDKAENQPSERIEKDKSLSSSIRLRINKQTTD